MNYQTVGGRTRQEDSFLDTSGFYAVADGLGGHPDGDKASQAAIKSMIRGEAYTESAKQLFENAHNAILAMPSDRVYHFHDRRPATTLLVARVLDPWVEFSCAGDCCGILIRKGEIAFQTARGGYGNTVSGYLGYGDSWTPDIKVVPYQRGDLLVLFTDGFDEAFGQDYSGPPGALAGALKILATLPLDQALVELEKATRAAGGTDNATIVAVQL